MVPLTVASVGEVSAVAVAVAVGASVYSRGATAEPTLDERHRMGFKVFLFLIVATGVFYAAKRKIWSRVH